MKIGAYHYPLTIDEPTRSELAFINGVCLSNETKLAQQTFPLFDSHDQPRVYSLGSIGKTVWDESKGEDADALVKLSEKYLDYIISVSYVGYKNGKPCHEMKKPFENMINSKYVEKLKFGMMFALASPRALIPYKLGEMPSEPNREFDMSIETARYIVDVSAQNYWNNVHYLYMENRPYISLWPYAKYSGEAGEGSISLIEFVNEVRTYAKEKYSKDPYIVGVIKNSISVKDWNTTDVDAITSYAGLARWGEDESKLQDYSELVIERLKEWNKDCNETRKPFAPSVVVDWDPTARNEYPKGTTLNDIPNQYPRTPILINASVEQFRNMLEGVYKLIVAKIPEQHQLLTICALNEVTEGMALLPRVKENKLVNSYFEELALFRKNL